MENILSFFAIKTAEASALGDIIADINRVIINPLITFFFAAALLLFLYGLVNFLAHRDTTDQTAMNGKRHMIWGIVGMLIMVSVFGILNFIANTLNVKGIDFKSGTTTTNNPLGVPTTTPGLGGGTTTQTKP